jgi:ubiquinone/menaquinone biosynthesis C-methylase UbiE
MMSADELGLPPVFWEVHQDLPRQGPGNNTCTGRAFEALGPLPRDARIVDVGCGPGMQTLELVRLSGGRVIALDRHRPFLHELRDRAAQADLSDRIATALGDMSALPFARGGLDLIWAEGAIYIMGFEAGLRAWRPLLRNEGYVAVTEITWLKSDPPEPLARFWEENYPALASADENVRRAEAAGYRVLDHFALPPEAWWEDYYTPIEARLPEMRNRYAQDPNALAAIDAETQEIDLFRRYSEYYGYVFYVLRNTGV